MKLLPAAAEEIPIENINLVAG